MKRKRSIKGTKVRVIFELELQLAFAKSDRDIHHIINLETVYTYEDARHP